MTKKSSIVIPDFTKVEKNLTKRNSYYNEVHPDLGIKDVFMLFYHSINARFKKHTRHYHYFRNFIDNLFLQYHSLENTTYRRDMLWEILTNKDTTKKFKNIFCHAKNVSLPN